MNERIKELRKALGFTQHEFADRLGISRGNIGSYEVGKSNPGGSVITLICKTFNVDEAWLRTGEGEMFVPSPNGVLDELAQKYGLSTHGKVIVEKFLDLKPDVQEAVAAYIEEVAAAFSDTGTTATVPAFAPAPVDKRTRAEKPVSEWTPEDIDAETEEYRRELIEEKRRAESGSASSASGETKLA